MKLSTKKQTPGILWIRLLIYEIDNRIGLRAPGIKSHQRNHSKTSLLVGLLNNYLIRRKILHQLDIIFNFENKIITWQEVSISMTPPNCMAKEFFAKSIKQILDAKNN